MRSCGRSTFKVWDKAVWGAALAFWLLVPASGAADTGGPKTGKVDSLLQQASSGSPQRVIIRTKPDAKSAVRQRLQNHGQSVYSDHPTIDALAALIHPEDIAELAADPDVESISADATVTASQLPPSTVNTGEGWLLYIGGLRTALGLDGSTSGSGVTVAVIDSGLAPGLDFLGRIVGFYDFTGGKAGQSASPSDEYGHGTHVAGLIGSSGVMSAGRYAGVAPGVRLLPLRVLDRNGCGYTSDVIRALEFAVANKDRFNIRVVNLSLGHPIYESAATDPLVQAVERAVRAGLIVVVAAGNAGVNPVTRTVGYAGIASPGNAASAITVGASNANGTVGRSDDRVSPFSSRGPSWYDGIAKPDIVAPGELMISNLAEGSTLAVLYPSLIYRSGWQKYLRLNGSSMATGAVSGLIALMLDGNQSPWSGQQARPFSAGAIKAILQYSATPLRDANGNNYDVLTQGSGLVNGAGALSLALAADPTKTAGSYWLSSAVQPWTRFDNTDELWSQTLIWGTRIIQGSSVIEINQAAWASNIVWGSGELDNIVWGTVDHDDNIVWGTSLGLPDVAWFGNVTLGDNIVWGTAEWSDNIVWGTGLVGFFDGDNIVWGTVSDDNIVWGTLSDDNIVWGTLSNALDLLSGFAIVGGGL